VRPIAEEGLFDSPRTHPWAVKPSPLSVINPDLKGESMPRRQGMAEAAVRPKKSRSRPLKGEDSEVKHVVETQNVSPDQARELLRRYGDDWRKIEEAARSYKDEK